MQAWKMTMRQSLARQLPTGTRSTPQGFMTAKQQQKQCRSLRNKSPGRCNCSAVSTDMLLPTVCDPTPGFLSGTGKHCVVLLLLRAGKRSSLVIGPCSVQIAPLRSID